MNWFNIVYEKFLVMRWFWLSWGAYFDAGGWYFQICRSKVS